MKQKLLNFTMLCLVPICQAQMHEGRPDYIPAGYSVSEINSDDLMAWDFLGNGRLSIVSRQMYMAESDGSAGVMLISPWKLREEVIVSYEVMSMSPASVLMALMSMSSSEDGSLAFDSEYNANMWHIVNSLNAYMTAFQNAAHNRYPFINRFPAMENPLVEADSSLMQAGIYYRIDVGREKDRLWLAIDGKKVLETVDPEPLGSGHFAFRLRGTGPETASCLIKNVRIYTNEKD